MFSTAPLFNEIINCTNKVVINQGGSSAGKTYAILQVLVYKAISESNKIITVVGQDIPNLKKGAYRDFEIILANSEYLLSRVKDLNKTDRVYTFDTGTKIEFNSFQDEQDAKGSRRDYLFVNEANGISWGIYWQLSLRTRKQIFIDYNPSTPFWAHSNLIDKDDNKLIISDHRNNPFLTEDEHNKIENIQDPDRWKVYARGLTGNVQGLIFPNWQQIPDEKYPDEDFIVGIDYGYTNDPTAIVKVCKVANNIYIKELAYETALPAKHIKDILDTETFDSNSIVYSEHDPEMISRLRRMGLSVNTARKGKGSIMAGINRLKEFNIFYTQSSKNLRYELERYEWVSDKDGKHTNVPIDKYNHLLDATRYAVYSHWFV